MDFRWYEKFYKDIQRKNIWKSTFKFPQGIQECIKTINEERFLVLPHPVVEKYIQYKSSLKILSSNSKQKLEVFLNVFKENFNFSFNLLTLIEENQKCGIKTLKSLALNIVFTKSLEIFLKDENKDIDSVIRYLDKYLSDMEDLGFFLGIIKK